MTVKLLGAVFILISCSAFGFALSQKEKYRLSDIEEFKRAVSFYTGCADLMGFSAEEALYKTAEKTNGAVGKMFRSAAEKAEKREYDSINEIWKKAVRENREFSFFEKEDLESVYSFGAVLGFMDSSEQKRNASVITDELTEREKSIRIKAEKNQKLIRSSVFLGGMLLCTLLF